MTSRQAKVMGAGAGAAFLVIGAAVWQGRESPPDLFVVRRPAAAETASAARYPGRADSPAPVAIDAVTGAGRTGIAASVLPPAPTGDYEIAVSDREFESIVEARYGPLLRSLSLPPNAAARLRELLTERQHAAIDVANAAMVAGFNPIRDLAIIKQAIALAEGGVDADLAHEFGAPVLSALREFENTRAERNTVDDLAGVLAASGDPLRPAQQQLLVRILQESPAVDIPVDIHGALYGRYDRRAAVSAGVIAAAAAELSPRQLHALRALQPAAPNDQASAR